MYRSFSLSQTENKWAGDKYFELGTLLFLWSPLTLRKHRTRSLMLTGYVVLKREWSFLEAALEGYPQLPPLVPAAVGSSPKGVLYFFW